MTNHPLTEEAVAERWNTHPHISGWNNWTERGRRGLLSIFRDAFDTGRKYERDNSENDRPWEPLAVGDPVRVGDEVRQEYLGVTATGIVDRVDGDGDPWTVEESPIGDRCLGIWHVRRPVKELPIKPGTVIVANDGHKAIEAWEDGAVWYANEAVLDTDGKWHGVWYWAEGRGVTASMLPEHIVAPTWKVKEK